MLPPFYCQGYTTQKERRTHDFIKQSTTKERINCKVNCCYAFCELQQQNAGNKNKMASYPHSPLTSIIPFQEGWMQTAGWKNSLEKLQPPEAAVYFRSFWKYPAGKLHRQHLDTEHTPVGESCSWEGRAITAANACTPLFSGSKASLLNTSSHLTLSISMFCAVLDDCFIFTTYTPPNTVIRDPM